MNKPRLFHFSDNPDIGVFHPRSVAVPSQRPPGREWQNGPLVWAIEEQRDYMYLFPRDCPRILIWTTERSREADVSEWLGEYRAAVYIERFWLNSVATATIHRYEFPTDSFEDLNDAGMWVSRTPSIPIHMDSLSELPIHLAKRGVDLRIVDSLVPYRSLWETSLHASGIRLSNVEGWSS